MVGKSRGSPYVGRSFKGGWWNVLGGLDKRELAFVGRAPIRWLRAGGLSLHTQAGRAPTAGSPGSGTKARTSSHSRLPVAKSRKACGRAGQPPNRFSSVIG